MMTGVAVEGIFVGSVKDSFATEHQIHNFFLHYFLIVIECPSLAEQGCRVLVPENFKYQRYHQLPLVQLSVVFGAYSSEPRFYLVQSFGLTLNVSGLSHHHELLCLADSGNPFSEIMRLLP